MGVALGIIAWNANREFQRNDDQEKRLRAIERACVKMDFMSEDIREIKGDMKKILREKP
jgi:hypothetical protein